MKSLAIAALLLASVLLVAGCGGKKSGEPSASPPGAAAGGASSGVAAVSPYDDGPRAAEGPVDEAKAEAGEKLFETKGCSACHGFGRRISGPDLKGVTMRRTTQWMEQQILHPDVMTRQDPIARQLFAQYALQMPNQGLKPDEANAVIEFLKQKDRESGESH